jgi:hypothetical protein
MAAIRVRRHPQVRESGPRIEKAELAFGGSSSAVRLRLCSGLTPDLESCIESALGHRVR